MTETPAQRGSGIYCINGVTAGSMIASFEGIAQTECLKVNRFRKKEIEKIFEKQGVKPSFFPR
ncbi:MAG: hypothetical protein ACLU38_05035 [Dysosmobacter sp.]